MNCPPSRYQFKSEQEFESAMAEWCAENEPRIFVRNYEIGSYKDIEVNTIKEAHELHDKIRMNGGSASYFVKVGTKIHDADYFFGYIYTAPSTCSGDYNADKHSIGRR